MKIGIVLVSGPYHHEAVDTVIHFTEAALQKGHTIEGIFLFMDGVYNINKYVKPTGERNVIEMLDSLGERVPITACAACGQFRGMKKEFSTKTMRLGGLGNLVTLAQTCDRVIMLGG
ncbi:MAG: DsrE family protein [Theionarchaea archaeon]|nr:DsrE family protein [Theionarchaea archaeon]